MRVLVTSASARTSGAEDPVENPLTPGLLGDGLPWRPVPGLGPLRSAVTSVAGFRGRGYWDSVPARSLLWRGTGQGGGRFPACRGPTRSWSLRLRLAGSPFRIPPPRVSPRGPGGDSSLLLVPFRRRGSAAPQGLVRLAGSSLWLSPVTRSSGPRVDRMFRHPRRPGLVGRAPVESR